MIKQRGQFGKVKILSSPSLVDRRKVLGGAVGLAATSAFYPVAGHSDDHGGTNAKSGGHFTVALQNSSATDTLDPATLMNGHTYTQNMALRNCLTEVNEKGDLVPELAEEWAVSDDLKTWSFKIRSNVEFHNGRTMTVNDVIQSLNLHRGDSSSSSVKTLAQKIDLIRADGDRVEITLSQGMLDWPYILSSPEFVILPADGESVDFRSGLGTGGYSLESYEPGVRTRLKRNPNYWKKNSAHFETVEIIGVNDGNARLNALLGRNVDAINRVNYQIANRLGQVGHVNVIEDQGTQHYVFPMNTKIAPFDDNNVRMALKHGVDRKALLRTVLSNHGQLGNDHPIGRTNRYFDPDIPQRIYDPDKAKYYLKAAGLSSLDIILHTSTGAFEGAVDAAVLLAEAESAAGINVKVNRTPADGYWSGVWMKVPWFVTWWGGRPTEEWMFSVAYSEGAPWNETNFSHERFNMLLQSARAERDEAVKSEIFSEMQIILRNEGGAIIPIFANHIAGVSKNIGYNTIVPSTYELSNYRAIERWWRKA